MNMQVLRASSPVITPTTVNELRTKVLLTNSEPTLPLAPGRCVLYIASFIEARIFIS